MVRRIFIDIEFTNLPWTGQSRPFWFGLADDSGRQWSAFDATADLREVSDFVRLNVLPKVPEQEPRLTGPELVTAVHEFCGDQVDEFWAWCPTPADLVALGMPAEDAGDAWKRWWDWDFQLLHELIQPWPSNWPECCGDLQGLAVQAGIEVPNNPNAHHPAADAAWGARVHRLATSPV